MNVDELIPSVDDEFVDLFEQMVVSNQQSTGAILSLIDYSRLRALCAAPNARRYVCGEEVGNDVATLFATELLDAASQAESVSEWLNEAVPQYLKVFDGRFYSFFWRQRLQEDYGLSDEIDGITHKAQSVRKWCADAICASQRAEKESFLESVISVLRNRLSERAGAISLASRIQNTLPQLLSDAAVLERLAATRVFSRIYKYLYYESETNVRAHLFGKGYRLMPFLSPHLTMVHVYPFLQSGDYQDTSTEQWFGYLAVIPTPMLVHHRARGVDFRALLDTIDAQFVHVVDRLTVRRRESWQIDFNVYFSTGALFVDPYWFSRTAVFPVLNGDSYALMVRQNDGLRACVAFGLQNIYSAPIGVGNESRSINMQPYDRRNVSANELSSETMQLTFAPYTLADTTATDGRHWYALTIEKPAAEDSLARSGDTVPQPSFFNITKQLPSLRCWAMNRLQNTMYCKLEQSVRAALLTRFGQRVVNSAEFNVLLFSDARWVAAKNVVYIDMIFSENTEYNDEDRFDLLHYRWAVVYDRTQIPTIAAGCRRPQALIESLPVQHDFAVRKAHYEPSADAVEMDEQEMQVAERDVMDIAQEMLSEAALWVAHNGVAFTNSGDYDENNDPYLAVRPTLFDIDTLEFHVLYADRQTMARADNQDMPRNRLLRARRKWTLAPTDVEVLFHRSVGPEPTGNWKEAKTVFI